MAKALARRFTTTAADGAGAVVPTISGCCQAILAYFAIDPENPVAPRSEDEGHAELRIGEISRAADHLAMTLLLPMPYGRSRMTIRTIDLPSISLPGMSLSPAIRAAAIGHPIGRLTGHPAFGGLDHLIVTDVQERRDAKGQHVTILHFEDAAEPLFRGRCQPTSRRIH